MKNSSSLFEPIDKVSITTKLKSLAVTDLVYVVLVSGNTVIGGLDPNWNPETDEVQLIFNSSDGEVGGRYNVITIPYAQIANIGKPPIADVTLPQFSSGEIVSVRDYPDNIATDIYELNTYSIKEDNLKSTERINRAFNTDAISSEGIYLTEDYLIYVDWEAFKRQQGSSFSFSVNLGPIGFNKILQPSIESYVVKTLTNAKIVEDIASIKPKIGKNVAIQGIIRVSRPIQHETFDGQLCHLYQVAINDETTIPLIVKISQLRLPVEFLHRLNSIIILYGEILQLPVLMSNIQYDRLFFARAIAYFSND